MKRLMIVPTLAIAALVAAAPIGASPIPPHQAPPVDATDALTVIGGGTSVANCEIVHWHGHAYCELEADSADVGNIQPRAQGMAMPQPDGSFTVTLRALSIDLNTNEVINETTTERYFPPGWTPPVYTDPGDIATHVIVDRWPTPNHNLWTNHGPPSKDDPVARVGCLFTGEVSTANASCDLQDR